MFRTTGVALGTLILAGLAACDRSAGSASCGIDALTGPLAVKQSFAEGRALAAVPETAPVGVAIRLVAGPAWHGTVAADGANRWQITTHGSVSRDAHVGFGVLVVDDDGATLGVLAYNGVSVRGAQSLGTLVIGDTVVPLIGVRMNPAIIQNAKCPVFPDSLR